MISPKSASAKLRGPQQVSELQPSNLPAIDPTDLLTVEELASRLKTKPSTIYQLCRRRALRPFPKARVGKELRFDWFAVSAWLRAQMKAA